MLEYVEIIKSGILIFPLIAIIITIPYLFYHYHKYGSLPLIRIIIVYSFILYLIVAYFLIIMPLPSIDEVQKMTGPSTQMIPFMFIKDLYDGINKVGIVNFYKTGAFYTVFFNICLTIPFGAYLKFYFKKDLKTTIYYSLLLSLFFELTQLSGLYFIYPRAYRLFDVDDLLINTLGGIVGYLIGILISYFMPSIDDVNKEAINKGQSISFTRRLSSFILDFIIYNICNALVSIFISDIYINLIVMFIYYIVIPYIDGQTIANKFFNIKIVDEDDHITFTKIFIRQISFYFGIFMLPKYIGSTILLLISHIDFGFRLIIMLMVCFICFVYYLTILIKMIKRERLFYDEFSNTKLVSTINKRYYQ